MTLIRNTENKKISDGNKIQKLLFFKTTRLKSKDFFEEI